jgi:hypothetical protein
MTETTTPLLLKHQISWKSEQEEKSCSMRTDRQTEMTKIIVAFRSFAKTSKMLSFLDLTHSHVTQNTFVF